MPQPLIRRLHPAWWLLLILVIYPFFPFLDLAFDGLFDIQLRLDRGLVTIFVFAILALALNLQLGYAGLLQLGIAAFFAIGAFSTGIVSAEKYPFQYGIWGAILVAPLVAGIAGLALAAPTIRLKGDYLAIVTLGFAEVVRVITLNLDEITGGPRGLSPIPDLWLPAPLSDLFGGDTAHAHFITIYFIALITLVTLIWAFGLLERSRTGRALMALREDELASATMGLNPARTKMLAFVAGAAIAGLAGAIFATNLKTTAEPNTYDFNYSTVVLCCVIVGGLGSIRGVLLGVALLISFDNIISPILTALLQGALGESDSVFTSLTNWRLMIYGIALILAVRFRPHGLWPAPQPQPESRPGGPA